MATPLRFSPLAIGVAAWDSDTDFFIAEVKEISGPGKL
jgi:hypothetical protein